MISNLRLYLPENIPWLQWTGCLATTLLTFVIGLMCGWPSPFTARLTAVDSPLPITMDEASWVVSMSSFGRILGAITSAVSIHQLGSKRTLFFDGFPMLFCWSFIILADSVIWLYIARFASGFSVGVAVNSLPIYLGEVSSPGIRGTLIALGMTGYSLGSLIGTLMGTYLSMSSFAWISLVPTVVSMLLFLSIPESPHYLIRKRNMKDAQRSILKYNPGVNVNEEFESLEKFLLTSNTVTFADALREFSIPVNRKSGIIAAALFLFMQASGMNTISFYSEIIIIKSGLTAVAPAMMVIILNVIGIIAGLSAMRLGDTCGRRILWNTTSGGTFVSLIIIGVHFTLLDNGFDPVVLQWLFMAMLIIWQVCNSGGIISVPSMVLSELLPPHLKIPAACLVGTSTGVFAFLFSKSYQSIVDAMGEAYVYWIQATVMGVAVIFGLTLLPETKGKSLQEIQNSLQKKQISRK